MLKLNSVLLIDDDPVTNFLNERLIKKHNVTNEVLVANNGEEGLLLIDNKLQSNNPLPELILLDLKMPVMDGFEFIENFNKIKQEVRINTTIIILTTSQHLSDKNRLARTGYTEILNKPLTDKMLLTILEDKFTITNSNK